MSGQFAYAPMRGRPLPVGERRWIRAGHVRCFQRARRRVGQGTGRVIATLIWQTGEPSYFEVSFEASNSRWGTFAVHLPLPMTTMTRLARTSLHSSLTYVRDGRGGFKSAATCPPTEPEHRLTRHGQRHERAVFAR